MAFDKITILWFVRIGIPAGQKQDMKPVNGNNGAAPSSSVTFTKQGALSINRQSDPEPLIVDIEVADTEVKRNQGLMYRRHMEFNQGMLFIMEELKEQSFYMRNTYISLDIIYLDQNKKIVSIAKNTEILNDNSISSNGDAMDIRPAIISDLDQLTSLFEGYRTFYRKASEPMAARKFISEDCC